MFACEGRGDDTTSHEINTKSPERVRLQLLLLNSFLSLLLGRGLYSNPNTKLKLKLRPKPPERISAKQIVC